jgi:cyclopropane fatty-acyl-phospholipid synthase-like methyltransferase
MQLVGDSWATRVTVEEMFGDWDYEAAVARLDRSPPPRSAVLLLDAVGSLGVGPGDLVLDIGGREGQHALVMAECFGCRVVSVDPSPSHHGRGQENVAAHDHGHLVEVRLGSIEQIPAQDESFELAYACDMLQHIEDLALALTECRRVLSPGGFMVIFEVFATPMLYPEEEQRLCADGAMVPERLSVANFEATVTANGFSVESLEILGSECVEAAQEAGTAPNHLLQVARLRRARETLVEELGEVPYRVIYASALWTIYRLIGKLESRIYVLRRTDD